MEGWLEWLWREWRRPATPPAVGPDDEERGTPLDWAEPPPGGSPPADPGSPLANGGGGGSGD